MKKQEVKEKTLKDKWIEKGHLDRNYPEEFTDLVIERFEAVEKWEQKMRKQGPPFNEQFCADVYAIASIMSKDDSFKGKFNPGALYDEMCETMAEMKKGKKEYSLYDEVKMLSNVMDNHKKKTATKK
jgi:hypothetical protein